MTDQDRLLGELTACQRETSRRLDVHESKLDSIDAKLDKIVAERFANNMLISSVKWFVTLLVGIIGGIWGSK